MRGKRGPAPDTKPVRKKTVNRRKPKAEVAEEEESGALEPPANNQEAITMSRTRIALPGERIETVPMALRVTSRLVTLYLSYTLNRGYRLSHMPIRGVIWKAQYPGTEVYAILNTMKRKYKGLSSKRPPMGVHKDIDKHLSPAV